MKYQIKIIDYVKKECFQKHNTETLQTAIDKAKKIVSGWSEGEKTNIRKVKFSNNNFESIVVENDSDFYAIIQPK